MKSIHACLFQEPLHRPNPQEPVQSDLKFFFLVFSNQTMKVVKNPRKPKDEMEGSCIHVPT